jgi:hypothetical protein
MSLDLYQDEALDRLKDLPPVQNPPVGTFDNFAKGAGMATMRGFAKTGRAIDLLGSVGAIAQDYINGGTEAQEKYFKEHEDVFQNAVDYWTPKSNEVGIAGDIVGSLISTLPTVIMSPALAVGATQLDTAEELARQGVSPTKAIAAGAVQGAGFGLGVWLPILGQTGWQRVVVGGALANAAQGVATRGITGEILEDTSAKGQFKAFDPTALTTDVLLGAAFGSLAHLSPAQRAQGAETWGKIKSWAENLSPSQVDALATLRIAQHMNVDSAAGIPEGLKDIEAHVNRMRTALDQTVRDEPVEVSTMPEPMMKADDARLVEGVKTIENMRDHLKEIAENIGVVINEVERGFHSNRNEGEIYVPYEGALVHGAQSADDVLAHELGHAAMQKRGLSFDRFPIKEMKKWVSNYDELVNASREFRPDLYATESAKGRRYVKNPEEVIADAIASVFTGRKPIDLLKPLMEKVGLTERDLGYLKKAQEGVSEVELQNQNDHAFAVKNKIKESIPAEQTAPDLLASETKRVLDTYGDQEITLGRNTDGTPITTTMKQFMDETAIDVAHAQEDAKLFEIAAGCYLGAK